MDQKNRKHRRSLAYWTLLAGFFLVTAAGTARMIASISNWYWLNFAGVQPGPLYLVITGGVWALIGLEALIWLWFRLPRNRVVATGLALLLAATYWLDRLLVRNPETGLQNTGFVIGLTLLGMMFVVAVLRPWVSFHNPKG